MPTIKARGVKMERNREKPDKFKNEVPSETFTTSKHLEGEKSLKIFTFSKHFGVVKVSNGASLRTKSKINYLRSLSENQENIGKRGKIEKNVKSAKNKDKFSNSKVLKIIFRCLFNRQLTDEISWKNENDGEFWIKFMNKNNPRWNKSCLSLFKMSESFVSEKRYMKYSQDAKHDEDTKCRFRSNLNKLVSQKKLEFLGKEKREDNSKYHTYRFVNYGDELKKHLLKKETDGNVRRKKFNKADKCGVNTQILVPDTTSGDQIFKFTQRDVNYNTCITSLSIPSPLSSGLGSAGSIPIPQSSELGRAYYILPPLSPGLGSRFSMPSPQGSKLGSAGSIASPQSSRSGSPNSISSPQSSGLGSAGSIASPRSSRSGSVGSIPSPQSSGLGSAGSIASPQSSELGNAGSIASPQSSGLGISYYILSPLSNGLGSEFPMPSPQGSELGSAGSITSPQSSELGSACSIASPESSKLGSVHSIASSQVDKLGSVGSIASFRSSAYSMPSPQSRGVFMPSRQGIELGITGSNASLQVSELGSSGSVESPQSGEFGSGCSFPTHCNELSNGLSPESSYSAEYSSTDEFSARLESLSKDILMDEEHNNTEKDDLNAISGYSNCMLPNLDEMELNDNMDFSTLTPSLFEDLPELDYSLHSFEQEKLTNLENMPPSFENFDLNAFGNQEELLF